MVLDWRYLKNESQSARHLNTIRLHPNSVINYKLPETSEARFRCSLKAVESSRAALDIVIKVDNKQVWKGRIQPGKSADTLSLDLPAGKEMVLEVSFAERIAFPCAIDISDAYLFSENLIKN